MAQSIQPRATPLPVAEGGTGASSQVGALVNLGVPLGTVEDVVAGAGLLGGGGGTSVELRLGVVQVAQGGTGATTQTNARLALGAAGTASPALTGNPTATTQALTDNSSRIATTEWVTQKIGTIQVSISGGTF